MGERNEMVRTVAVFGTGTVGGHAIRAVQMRDDLELVGAKVYTDEKDGRDVGELLGEAPMGVTATNDLGVIVAAKPDCVLYCPNAPIHDEIVALLEAGIDVITVSGGYLFYPFRDPELAALLQSACDHVEDRHSTAPESTPDSCRRDSRSPWPRGVARSSGSGLSSVR